MSEADGWSGRVSPLVMLAYHERIFHRCLSLISPILGSLIDPKQEVRKFVDQDLPRDPEPFRAWVVEEFFRWVRLRNRYAKNDTSEGVQEAMHRYIQGENIEDE